MLVRTWSVAVVFVVAMLGVGCSAEMIDTSETATSSDALSRSADCELVRCAMPLCAQGQHLSYRGGCCPVCVGAPSRCATVLCAAVACGEGEQLVTSPGDCCGRCMPAHATQECRDDLDCPQYACITCPCPVSDCVGGHCVTSTPDASTCGSTL